MISWWLSRTLSASALPTSPPLAGPARSIPRVCPNANTSRRTPRSSLPGRHVIYFASMTTTVLVADDSEIMRKAIADLLKGDPEIEVVAERVGFAQTIEIAAKLRPQVIVLDVHMTDERTGTRAQVGSGLKGSRLLAISVWNDDETKYLAEAMGAAVLLDKTKLAKELIPAIRHHANRISESTVRTE